jgi:hypothetical protein
MGETLEILFSILGLVYLVGFLSAVKRVNRIFGVLELLLRIQRLRLDWLSTLFVSMFFYGMCVIWFISWPLATYYVNKNSVNNQ